MLYVLGICHRSHNLFSWGAKLLSCLMFVYQLAENEMYYYNILGNVHDFSYF